MSTPYKKVLKLICVFLILAKPSLSVSGNYANQGEDWTGSCAVNGTTQSPFSISAGTNDPNL